MKNNGYPRAEKLKQKKEIGQLFENGTWKTYNNLRAAFCVTSGADLLPYKVGVSVSKRNFKRAVDRNKIKRLLRECYRLNKEIFINSFGDHTITMLFWTSKEMPKKYRDVEGDFLKLCQKVQKARTTITQ